MNFIKNISLFISCFIGSEQKKHDSRHAFLSAIAKKFSFRMYSNNLMWFNDKEFLTLWRGFNGRRNSSIHERRFNLYYFAKSVSNVPGDTVECGAYEGASSYIILKTNEKNNKIHHIFDSFEGLSNPDINDMVKKNRVFKWQKSDLAISEEIVKRNLSSFNTVNYYKGWIPSKFGEVADIKFSFVHIDVDLFQPTYDSLTFFYDRISPSGILICDDYGFETCPGANKAMNDFFLDKPEKIIHLTTGQGVVIKQSF